MKRLLLASLILLILLFSFCGTKKDERIPVPQTGDIISSDEMARVLEDVYLAEGAVNKKEVDADNPKKYAYHYYDYVIKKHNLTNEVFIDSYVYYSSMPDEMVKILDVVIGSLSQKQGLLLVTDEKKDTLTKVVK